MTAPPVGTAAEEDILKRAEQDLSQCRSAHDLDQAKSAYLGKKGSIAALLKGLGALPAQDRPAAGARINLLRERFTEMLETRRKALESEGLERRIAGERVDVTLPARGEAPGSLHPVSLTLERAVDIFHSMGFDVAEGPEVESDHHNFTLLNHPQDHPARSMHDTFYIKGYPDHLLRTHTSPVQVRYMERHAPPLRAIAPGRVYRVDSDATHSPMFHQIEGIWIDDRVRFSDLKGVLGAFFRAFFERDDIQVRFRPSFFPFTEPSAECDMLLDGDWMEICGCGMVHPNVLASGGIDANAHRGFAFGVGVERLAMLRYGIRDIRLLFDSDARFLGQFA